MFIGKKTGSQPFLSLLRRQQAWAQWGVLQVCPPAMEREGEVGSVAQGHPLRSSCFCLWAEEVPGEEPLPVPTVNLAQHPQDQPCGPTPCWGLPITELQREFISTPPNSGATGVRHLHHRPGIWDHLPHCFSFSHFRAPRALGAGFRDSNVQCISRKTARCRL
jgi:hypothetical protein